MAHRVMIAPREYSPIDDFRNLVFQLRFRVGTNASIIIEAYTGDYLDILATTLEHWVAALQELARIERQEMTLEEYDEMMWAREYDAREDHEDMMWAHEDDDFDPTMME